jgi:hypothetical protein
MNLTRHQRQKYLGNYLDVKLSTAFILDVCKPVMEMISFFESEKIRIHSRHTSKAGLTASQPIRKCRS